MRKSYGVPLLTAVVLLIALSGAAYATEYLIIHAVKGCLPLQQANAAHISLQPGMAYTVTVAGDAATSSLPDGEYDGVYCFYYDNDRPLHPQLEFLSKDDELDFVASDVDFYAFLPEDSQKSVKDNLGQFMMTFTPRGAGGVREELMVHAVINCIGLEDYAIAKEYLMGGQPYSATVSGNAATNTDPDGFFDGVFLFYKEIDVPVHPVMKTLLVGEQLGLVPHSLGWVFGFVVDEGYATMFDNTGTMTVEFEEASPVEEESWGGIKVQYRW